MFRTISSRATRLPLCLAAFFIITLSGADAQADSPHIARVWHGRVPTACARAYARYLSEAIRVFPTIAGNEGYEMFRETVGSETHFMVVSYWSSREAIMAFAGKDIRRVHPLPRDAQFLIQPERMLLNYDIVEGHRH